MDHHKFNLLCIIWLGVLALSSGIRKEFIELIYVISVILLLIIIDTMMIKNENLSNELKEIKNRRNFFVDKCK